MRVHTKLLALLSMQGCRDYTKERRNMTHLWQYSDNAGIATHNKPVVSVGCLHTCSEEEVRGIRQVWDYLKGLSPCPLSLTCSRRLLWWLICVLASERSLQEQHPSLKYYGTTKRVHKQRKEPGNKVMYMQC